MKKQKILYGAGHYGKQAFSYYGADMVYAFADRSKHGEIYCGKPVLEPSELFDYKDSHEIIICVKKYGKIIEYLKSLSVNNFELFIALEDVRCGNQFNISPVTQYQIEEMSKLDFIETPEHISKYIDFYLSHFKRTTRVTKSNEKDFDVRYIEENKIYGYYSEMARYANRNNQYYEAPSVCHYYNWVDDLPLDILWFNLIEAGSNRRAFVHKLNKDCLYFAVGPYMDYVKPYYEKDRLNAIKKRWGRTLVIFPVHTNNSTVNFDRGLFINSALEYAKSYNTIVVCSYWADYNKTFVREFRSLGAKVVTAGFIDDPMFTRRLKTIMQLADGIFTNSLGSHVGHAISMGVPIKYFSQNIVMHSTEQHMNCYLAHPSHTRLEEMLIMNGENHKSDDLLTAFEPSLGFSHHKSEAEMGAILDLSKRIIVNSGYKRSMYIESIRKTYRELQSIESDTGILQFSLMKGALPVDYESHLAKLGG